MQSFIGRYFQKWTAGILTAVFSFTSVVSPSSVQAQLALTPPVILPAVGAQVNPSSAFMPTLIKGMTIDPKDAFHFEFLLDSGDAGLSVENGHARSLQDESMKLIKYFLASLALPEKEMWVNLSPVEKDRIIPELFGQTDMGRDLLGQDYILKQLTATLMSPENEAGKKMWERIYEKVYEKESAVRDQSSGFSDSRSLIPDALSSFNKVWIVPQTGYFYEHENTVFIVDAKLKVMLESDYFLEVTSNEKRETSTKDVRYPLPVSRYQDDIKQMIRDVIIPIIEQEINEGENFANLRQIYNAMLLSVWFKKRMKEHLLGQVYADQEKVAAISYPESSSVIEGIWKQYVETFQSGAANVIKEEYDPATQTVIPRKYFTGGAVALNEAKKLDDAQLAHTVATMKSPATVDWRMTEPDDKAMMTEEEREAYKKAEEVLEKTQKFINDLPGTLPTKSDIGRGNQMAEEYLENKLGRYLRNSFLIALVLVVVFFIVPNIPKRKMTTTQAATHHPSEPGDANVPADSVRHSKLWYKSFEEDSHDGSHYTIFYDGNGFVHTFGSRRAPINQFIPVTDQHIEDLKKALEGDFYGAWVQINSIVGRQKPVDVSSKIYEKEGVHHNHYTLIYFMGHYYVVLRNTDNKDVPGIAWKPWRGTVEGFKKLKGAEAVNDWWRGKSDKEPSTDMQRLKKEWAAYKDIMARLKEDGRLYDLRDYILQVEQYMDSFSDPEIKTFVQDVIGPEIKKQREYVESNKAMMTEDDVKNIRTTDLIANIRNVLAYKTHLRLEDFINENIEDIFVPANDDFDLIYEVVRAFSMGIGKKIVIAGGLEPLTFSIIDRAVAQDFHFIFSDGAFVDASNWKSLERKYGSRQETLPMTSAEAIRQIMLQMVEKDSFDQMNRFKNNVFDLEQDSTSLHGDVMAYEKGFSDKHDGNSLHKVLLMQSPNLQLRSWNMMRQIFADEVQDKQVELFSFTVDPVEVHGEGRTALIIDILAEAWRFSIFHSRDHATSQAMTDDFWVFAKELFRRLNDQQKHFLAFYALSLIPKDLAFEQEEIDGLTPANQDFVKIVYASLMDEDVVRRAAAMFYLFDHAWEREKLENQSLQINDQSIGEIQSKYGIDISVKELVEIIKGWGGQLMQESGDIYSNIRIPLKYRRTIDFWKKYFGIVEDGDKAMMTEYERREEVLEQWESLTENDLSDRQLNNVLNDILKKMEQKKSIEFTYEQKWTVIHYVKEIIGRKGGIAKDLNIINSETFATRSGGDSLHLTREEMLELAPFWLEKAEGMEIIANQEDKALFDITVGEDQAIFELQLSKTGGEASADVTLGDTAWDEVIQKSYFSGVIEDWNDISKLQGTVISVLTRFWMRQILFPFLFSKGFDMIHIKSANAKSELFFKELGFQLSPDRTESDRQFSAFVPVIYGADLLRTMENEIEVINKVTMTGEHEEDVQILKALFFRMIPEGSVFESKERTSVWAVRLRSDKYPEYLIQHVKMWDFLFKSPASMFGSEQRQMEVIRAFAKVFNDFLLTHRDEYPGYSFLPTADDWMLFVVTMHEKNKRTFINASELLAKVSIDAAVKHLMLLGEHLRSAVDAEDVTAIDQTMSFVMARLKKLLASSEENKAEIYRIASALISASMWAKSVDEMKPHWKKLLPYKDIIAQALSMFPDLISDQSEYAVWRLLSNGYFASEDIMEIIKKASPGSTLTQFLFDPSKRKIRSEWNFTDMKDVRNDNNFLNSYRVTFSMFLNEMGVDDQAMMSSKQYGMNKQQQFQKLANDLAYKSFPKIEQFPQDVNDIVLMGNDNLETFRIALRFIQSGIGTRIMILGGYGRLTIPLLQKAISAEFEVVTENGTRINQNNVSEFTDQNRPQISESAIIKQVMEQMIEKEPEFSSLNNKAVSDMIVLEERSTNSPENLKNYRSMISQGLVNGEHKIVLIQGPEMQMRALSTFHKIFEQEESFDKIKVLSYTTEYSLDGKTDEELVRFLVGEAWRLSIYALKGDLISEAEKRISEEVIPDVFWTSARNRFEDLPDQEKKELAQYFQSLIPQGFVLDNGEESKLSSEQAKLVSAIKNVYESKDLAMMAKEDKGKPGESQQPKVTTLKDLKEADATKNPPDSQKDFKDIWKKDKNDKNDKAMMGKVQDIGGVDLNVDQADIRIQQSENGFKFPKVDPAMLKMDPAHMIPVILDIKPMSIKGVYLKLGLAIPVSEQERDSEFSSEKAIREDQVSVL